MGLIYKIDKLNIRKKLFLIESKIDKIMFRMFFNLIIKFFDKENLFDFFLLKMSFERNFSTNYNFYELKFLFM